MPIPKLGAPGTAGFYEREKALSVATVGEIDPADTRAVVLRALAAG